MPGQENEQGVTRVVLVLATNVNTQAWGLEKTWSASRGGVESGTYHMTLLREVQ